MTPARYLMTCLSLWAITITCAADAASPASSPRTGWYETGFDLASPLADRTVITERMLLPSLSREVMAHARETGRPLAGHSVDPTEENFVVYVPEDYDASQTYGLFVWVSAREEVTVPRKWARVFREHDMIFVGADEAGNRTNDLDRRVPLALHSVANLEALYRIDPARVYVAGLSGGGRVASKIAAAFGDVFTGGYFIVGSDPMGTVAVPVPPRDVLDAMRGHGRYVFLTGKRDTPTIAATRTALASWQRLCLFNSILHFPNMGHGLPNILWFGKAIEYLENGYRADRPAASEVLACDSDLDQAIAAESEAVRTSISSGALDDARAGLKGFQLRFGRLAIEEFDALYEALAAALQ